MSTDPPPRLLQESGIPPAIIESWVELLTDAVKAEWRMEVTPRQALALCNVSDLGMFIYSDKFTARCRAAVEQIRDELAVFLSEAGLCAPAYSLRIAICGSRLQLSRQRTNG